MTVHYKPKCIVCSEVGKGVNYHSLIPMQKNDNDHEIIEAELLSLSELLFNLYIIVEPWN